MGMGQPKAERELSETEHTLSSLIARLRLMPTPLSLRARMVLACAAGQADNAVARCFQSTNATVGKWRRRLLKIRISGLCDELRAGKPRSIDDEHVAALIHKMLHRKSKSGSTHWSVRTAAAENSISKSRVQRYFQLFGLRPHRTKIFKFSTDAFFIEKLREVLGLYLNPPHNSLVLCVVEKIQWQALERTQPILPLGVGYVEGITHDYKRHGTTTVFAALNMYDGTVLADCKRLHRHYEFLAFMSTIEAKVPADLNLQLIVDNHRTHKYAKVTAWLAKRPRWHIHFIQAYCSWLNTVERFFALITGKTICRGSFRSVKQLVGKIDHFVTQHNKICNSFPLIAAADFILAKLDRLTSRISGTGP